ncbi:MAG TPA: CRISPR-associated endonuclease Cas1, partial [Candidatus Deferrimicrobium sp.]|nr:CRISPR-associated endonuclease Cas1 [Candidatus Deferrimicrobium sp.]
IGSRKGISRERAVELIKIALAEGYEYMIESDIEEFFPSVDLQVLHRLLDSILPAGDTMIKQLLEKLTGNGYLLEGRFHERLKGLALGNPLSPCLANLYLDSFDEYIKELDVRLIRYVDDFLIFCKSPGDAEKVLAETRSFLLELGLKIKMEKTILKHVREGFSFLGITFNNGAIANTSEEYEKLFKKPLYIVEPYVFMSISGEAAVLKKDQAVIDTIPLRRISEIMVMEKTVFSSSVIRYCTENRIPFTLTLNSGYYITTIKPDSKKYYEISYAHTLKFNSLSDTECLCIAKEFAAGKIINSIAFFSQRYNKGENLFLQELEEASSHIYQAADICQVRGIEGIMSRKIFERLNDHIKSPDFRFKKRMRQQPDRINSLLNFGYYLLFSMINATIRALGLNPYLGFLHSPGDNFESLVCDIQELFRARINRFIIRVINKKIITCEDFIESRNGFYLNKEGVTKFLNHFEGEMNRKNSKSALSLKEHIYIQANIIKNWVLENKSLTFYKWDVSSEAGDFE